MTPFDPIEDAIEAIRRGEIVVVTDAEARTNAGHLIMAADAVTASALAFFGRHASGVICIALTGDRCDELNLLPTQSPTDDSDVRDTAPTVSLDLGTFGPSGHVVPLRARPGGVLGRAGHTEAAVDLARLAGRPPAGVLCEIVRSEMTHGSDLRGFADEHGLLLVSIAELIRHRRSTEKLVERAAAARVPTEWGDFRCHSFTSVIDGETHLAFATGNVAGGEPVLVRVHSECVTGDVFGSVKCDCGPQLREAMRRVAAEGRGVVVYLRGHEGRGIGISHKLRAYELQDRGFDTVDANVELGLPVDRREYAIGAQILVDLGVRRMRLLTNNPAKYGGLEGFGLTIEERIPLHLPAHPEAVGYLRAKRDRMGHLLPDELERPAEPGPP